MPTAFDWKGRKVNIQIWFNWTDLVFETDVYLDTDTMLDLFAVYDPALYSFNIEPVEDEDADWNL